MKNLRKIVSILLAAVITLSSTSIILLDHSLNVKADGGEGESIDGIGLDSDFVWKITRELCNVTHEYPEGTIPKGRAFGTWGDQHTASNILELYMSDTSYCNLTGVDKLQLGHIDNSPRQHYSSKVQINKIKLSISHPYYTYPYSNPMHLSEYFTAASAFPYEFCGDITHNYTFTNAKVYKRPQDLLNWPFGGTYNNYSLNISGDILNSNDILVGNVTYIDINESFPNEQHSKIFIIDEIDGCNNKIANISSNASGCLLIHNSSRGYSFQNASLYSFSIARINSDANNLTNLTNMLQNNESIIVDNVLDNETLTFTYNLTNTNSWPGDDFVYIVDKNPKPSEVNEQYGRWRYALRQSGWFWARSVAVPGEPRCHGMIFYDSFETHFMAPTTRDWDAALSEMGPALPIYSINYSVGDWIWDHIDLNGRPLINGFIDQEHKLEDENNPGVEAYNVVGYRNITKSPNDNITVISNRYDGWWGETPGDSGVGGAIVLGLAKYFSDYNIVPKYNLTFLMTTGEEYGFRGAYHFIDSHPEADFSYNLWLGMDQLAFDQPGTNLTLGYRDYSDDEETKILKIIFAIANESRYADRSGYGLKVSKRGIGGTDGMAWKTRCDVIGFGKGNEGNWNGYHRSGLDYSIGDSLSKTDREDVNYTLELAWNVTKYFTVDPNCWIESYEYDAYDSPDDGDTLKDSIRVNYTLKSILPHDTAYIEIWRTKHLETMTVSTLETTISHTINRSGVTNSYLCSIPDDTSKGNYSMQLKVYNSTGWIQSVTGIDLYEYNDTTTASDTYQLFHSFGYTEIGNQSQSIEDRICGSTFIIHENATADNITAHIYSPTSVPSKKSKCMIYRANDSILIGETEEMGYGTPIGGEWKTYSFTSPKPILQKDTEYILNCWGESSTLSFLPFDSERGRYNQTTYGAATPEQPVFTNESRLYSIYCSYTPDSEGPEINNITSIPSPAGLGDTVTITADVTDDMNSIDTVEISIDQPGGCTGQAYQSMTFKSGSTYEYSYNDTWNVGTYNFTIKATDTEGNQNTTSTQNFTITSNGTITVCTIKDTYTIETEYINLTDPPGFEINLGYQYLDNGDVLHIWNRYDNYYFNTTSGIQQTNHYNEYWAKNILMLGYYNNDQWNLIYRTDQLTNFTQAIETDNQTYINITWWRDLSYGGYPFRLAIHYHLGLDDNELTVIPYIKNIGQTNIPYTLGFGWELKDIQINMTTENDIIDVNNTMYLLNQTLDNTYTNLSEPIYRWNASTNTTEIIGYTQPVFFLRDNITETSTKSMYLRWDKDLIYKLRVKSRTGQTNAPVTLSIRIGILAAGQQKYTTMYWYDADQSTYYFNSYSPFITWATNPSHMTDGSTSTFASTSTDGDVERCIGNTYNKQEGTISKVEIRAYAKSGQTILLQPVFGGTTEGSNYEYALSGEAWSQWFDITDDENAPSSWTWTDIRNLDCDVETELASEGQIYCAKVEVRVTYSSPDDPVISAMNPSDEATGISITPTLNVTVSDPNGDTMNITWLSNSSGSWQTFGTNTSVSNGTYYQTFSNATTNGQWWWWRINVTDGAEYTLSDVYKFYTGNQSKIVNTGSTNISGYLLIQIQYYLEETWVLADDTINETTKRTITAGNTLCLDTIFNGEVNTNSLSSFGSGLYRIYAAFRDPYGNVLICDDETLLKAYYEFDVAFS